MLRDVASLSESMGGVRIAGGGYQKMGGADEGKWGRVRRRGGGS